MIGFLSVFFFTLYRFLIIMTVTYKAFKESVTIHYKTKCLYFRENLGLIVLSCVATIALIRVCRYAMVYAQDQNQIHTGMFLLYGILYQLVRVCFNTVVAVFYHGHMLVVGGPQILGIEHAKSYYSITWPSMFEILNHWSQCLDVGIVCFVGDPRASHKSLHVCVSKRGTVLFVVCLVV